MTLQFSHTYLKQQTNNIKESTSKKNYLANPARIKERLNMLRKSQSFWNRSQWLNDANSDTK